jgi:hypothetical protein
MTTSFNPYIFIEKLFPSGSSLVPFIGTSLGYYSTSYDDDYSESISTIILQGFGGGKYFINENTAIQARAIFTYATDDVFYGEDYLDDYEKSPTDFTIDVGINFYF